MRALQGKEGELQQLRQALRERDRLIEKINTAVLESQEKNKVRELQMWQFHFLTCVPYVFIKISELDFFYDFLAPNYSNAVIVKKGKGKNKLEKLVAYNINIRYWRILIFLKLLESFEISKQHLILEGDSTWQ